MLTPALDPPTADALRRLCAELSALDLRTSLVVDRVGDEADVRLRVHRAGRTGLSVELLAPDPSAWSSGTWDAVRVEHGRRQVWRGPGHGCSTRELRRFVQALLCLGAAQLAGLYVDLG